MKVLLAGVSPLWPQVRPELIRQLRPRSIQQVSSGADALALLTSEAPDLIIADWYLPEVTGAELLALARNWGARAAVGILTPDRIGADVRQKAADLGARFVLEAPFTPHGVRAALDGLLAGSPERGHLTPAAS